MSKTSDNLMITENIKAVLLLTSFFNSNELGKYKTLSINEYGYFACWLNQNGQKPVDLLNEDSFDNIWGLWDEPLSHVKAKKIIDFSRLENTIANITYDRIKDLLNRGASLSLALDKWQSAGVWIIDRQHEHYPKNIKKQLKHQSPALLFGVGDSALLIKPAIGFVGSRDCNHDDEQATTQYVQHINQLSYQVVSGGAKGVDSHAMLASLNNGNTAIGVLADSLFKASASNQWRQHLKANNLVLVSPFYPEGRFTPANAMARNKYIYLLSNATLVITSGEKGGTWEGAKENLKKDWVPLLVSTHQEPLQAGNQGLINGSVLGKVKTKNSTKAQAKALSITPTTSSEQFSELLFKGHETTPLKTEAEPSSKPTPSTNETLKSPNTNLDLSNKSSLQEDMFSMPLNFEHEAENLENTQSQFIENTQKVIEPQSLETPDNIAEHQTDLTENKRGLNDDTNESNPVAKIEANSEKKIEAISQDSVEVSHADKLASPAPSVTPDKAENTKLESQPPTQTTTTPLLDNFYHQLCVLIQAQPKNLIDISELENHFPEFEIMGKTALDKWLKHLVEIDKLVKPNARKKQYTLPVA
ncbi:DNA-processing protein DprA [Colwellia sp. Arc7-D]|uniref:DNA-processing protein DprA n=1 Tax=Colwellia sp. Arc7-D TaxID=2161872 RepID=UPI000D3D7A45|nr:DNA-processing protein DprA [Colwellia sp. Arc7-D]AWB57837.1 hypothetical protein DBO93_09815 [Colwellia sp. Arc7-D]